MALLLSAVLVLVFGLILVVEGPGCAPCSYLFGGHVSGGRASDDSMVGVANVVGVAVEVESAFHYSADSSSATHHPVRIRQ